MCYEKRILSRIVNNSVDTVLHLLAISCGAEFGFKFTSDNFLAPIDIIQQAYSESYKLKYHPIVMCPGLFHINSKQPVYYSLQYPNCYALSPRSRRTSHIIQNLTEIQEILTVFLNELEQQEIGCPFAKEISTKINFNCYHVQSDKENRIKSTVELPRSDPFYQRVHL